MTNRSPMFSAHADRGSVLLASLGKRIDVAKAKHLAAVRASHAGKTSRRREILTLKTSKQSAEGAPR